MDRFIASVVVAASVLLAGGAFAQTMPEIGFKSVGRAAPLAAAIPSIAEPPAATSPPGGPPPFIKAVVAVLQQGAVVGPLKLAVPGPGGKKIELFSVGDAWGGDVPKGVKALPIDIFTSTDFYKDRALWSDPRYFRCNSPLSLEVQWGALSGGPLPAIIGDDPPRSAAWGRCDRDYPRKAIVSPYPFKTAQAHWQALLAETRGRGGPTRHTRATTPDWGGRYISRALGDSWYSFPIWTQVSSIASLLTPEYQTRLVQQAYHEGHDNALQWPAQYCWPEGFMRRWNFVATAGGPDAPDMPSHRVVVTPSLVQITTGTADNFITDVYIGRSFDMTGQVPRLGADVPRWNGETIGFWDGDVLITWTSNIQGWTSHGLFEFSSKLQTIEIYTPLRDKAGKLTGLNHEAVLYDPDALVEPIRIVNNLSRVGGFEAGAPRAQVVCIPTIFPVDGRAVAKTPGNAFMYEVPDMYGRPWAKIWEKYFEKGMERPSEQDLFDFKGKP